MSVNDLSLVDRKRLVQLACVTAWSDADLASEERELILNLCTRLELPEEEIARVREWIAYGPPNLDPNDVPYKHRKVFMDVVQEVVEADGRIDPEESETIRLLTELLG